jgi:predicted nucleotidyltransferase
MSHRENITRIKAVYNALEELAHDVVFVGGATVSLYTDRPATEVRPTDDIDILVELAHYSGYAAVEEKLREKGFVNDVESGVICRYNIQGIIVDVMATSDKIFGFANRWYEEAFQHAEEVAIDKDYNIRIFSAPYFIATKLEAFKDRGDNDGRLSSDFEDIVYVLNNRSTIWQEMGAANKNLRKYLKNEFARLLANPYIDEWIGSNLEHNEQNRVRFILGNLQEHAVS